MTATLQARLAALSVDVSPETAESLFKESLESLRDQKESSGRRAGNSEWAFYRASIDAAQARVELEDLWRREPEEDEFYLSQRPVVPRYMVAIDLQRALEMLNELDRNTNAGRKKEKQNRSPLTHTKLQIAEYLLMSPLERLLAWNSGESGFSMEF
jgi:hypothetical protein